MKTKSRQSSSEKGISPKDWKNIFGLYDACMINAADLLTEAELLYKHDHFSRAFALAIIAFEEIGKGQIVADLFNGQASKEEFKEAFKKHEIKSAYNFRRFMLSTEPLYIPYIDYDKSKGKKYNTWRINATYVNCLNDYKAQEPKNIITKENARKAIDFVNKEINEIKKMELITERIGSKSFMK